MMRRAAKRKPRRSRAEVMLERFEALDPESLDADQRRYRDFAIRALRIELTLRAQGMIGTDGQMRAPAEATAPPAARRRRRPG